MHTPWKPMTEAPTDGTLFDGIRNGIRYTDCHIDQHGRQVKQGGYPQIVRVFRHPLDGWMPRPAGILAPYETNAQGEKYLPQLETELG